jgi:hypothetical protein
MIAEHFDRIQHQAYYWIAILIVRKRRPISRISPPVI